MTTLAKRVDALVDQREAAHAEDEKHRERAISLARTTIAIVRDYFDRVEAELDVLDRPRGKR